MTRKQQKMSVVTRPKSEKARGTAHKRSRALSLNLAAAKLRRRKKLSKKIVPDAADGWSATRVKDEQTDLVSFVICGPTRGGDTFRVSIPAEQREEQKRVRKTLRSYDAALPGQVDDDLAFLDELFDGANLSPRIATSKPGFTDAGKGFVLGAQMLGDAAEQISLARRRLFHPGPNVGHAGGLERSREASAAFELRDHRGVDRARQLHP